MAEHRLGRVWATAGGFCDNPQCRAQYLPRAAVYECEEGCEHDQMAFTLCYDCKTRADQAPSEAQIALDRTLRAEAEARDVEEERERVPSATNERDRRLSTSCS